MKTVWLVFVILCSIGNVVNVVYLWHTGGQPDWFVWLSSISFSIGVALKSFEDLTQTS